jgi:protein tyrosine phosphatase (PTP) superfamily phosphohydrolase (DUF442 family)
MRSLILLLAICFWVGCSSHQQPATQTPPATKSDEKRDPLPEVAAKENADSNASAAKIEKIDAKHLPNPIRIHDKVISGGLPEGDSAFAELKSLGIKTVISVDGAKPDVATAEKYGMRYVHLPHGYDGIPEQRAKELAKAVRDLPGGVYIHCHHGKHRSPAASAVACVGAGLIGISDAVNVLKVAGTSESYRGLFQSAAEAHPLDKALLDELKSDFPASAKLPEMAEAMVAIEHVHDRLKAIEKAGWKVPADQPDLIPDHEALLLREHFTEFLRTKELQSEPEKFQQLAKEGEAAAQALEDALKSKPNTETASKLFLAVSNNCKACHQTFRDVPLKEKKHK